MMTERLSRLVVAAHDHCVRVNVTAAKAPALRVALYDRVRVHENGMVMAHPTLEDHVALIRGQIDTKELLERMKPGTP